MSRVFCYSDSQYHNNRIYVKRDNRYFHIKDDITTYAPKLWGTVYELDDVYSTLLNSVIDYCCNIKCDIDNAYYYYALPLRNIAILFEYDNDWYRFNISQDDISLSITKRTNGSLLMCTLSIKLCDYSLSIEEFIHETSNRYKFNGYNKTN